MDARSDGMVDGALIGIGAVAVVDNVVAHWVLGLHRAVLLGAVAIGVGVWREVRARRRVRP